MRPLVSLTVLLVLAFVATPPAAAGIVFSCHPDLCSLDPGSGEVSKLTRDGVSGTDRYDDPQLSADGRELAFFYGDRPYVADRRAHRRREILRPRGPLANAGVPRFRPGGREAYFHYGGRLCRGTDVTRRRARCGRPAPEGRGYWAWGPRGSLLSTDLDVRRDLCSTDLHGRCRRSIVSLPPPMTFFQSPATAPGDERIAATVAGLDDEGMRIVTFSARSGRRIRTLTSGHSDLTPSYSPDGRWIAFTRDPVVEGPVVASICIVRARGGRVRCPVKRMPNIGPPVWGG